MFYEAANCFCLVDFASEIHQVRKRNCILRYCWLLIYRISTNSDFDETDYLTNKLRMVYIGIKTLNIFYNRFSFFRPFGFRKIIVFRQQASCDISHNETTIIRDNADLFSTLQDSLKCQEMCSSSSVDTSLSFTEVCSVDSNKEKVKKRPNYFIGVQINDPDVKASIKKIQDSLLLQNKNLEKFLISMNKLHLTLMVIHLKDVEEHSRAMKALHMVHQKYNNSICEEPIKLEFKGLGQFNNRVLYAKIKDDASSKRLYELANCINSYLANVGIFTTDTRKELNLHLTIAKIDFKKKSSKVIKKIQPSLYEEFIDLSIGYDIVKSIQLLKMNGPKTPTGYYSGDELLFSSTEHIPWRKLNALLAIAEKKKEIKKSITKISKKLFF